MTGIEYEKELLLAKIEAHRTIVRLETRLARATFDPWHAALSFLGADTSVTGAVASSMRAVLSGRHEGSAGVGALVLLLVAALLPLVEGLRTSEAPEPSPVDEPVPPSE